MDLPILPTSNYISRQVFQIRVHEACKGSKIHISNVQIDAGKNCIKFGINRMQIFRDMIRELSKVPLGARGSNLMLP